MNCEQFQDIYQDLARNEWLDVATIKDALEHADTCATCDDLLQEAEALSASLRSLSSFDASRQAAPQIENNVLDAFSAKKSSAFRQSNLRLMTVASLTCIAAAALFVLLLMHHKATSGPVESRPSSPTANSNNGRQEASLGESGTLLNDSGTPEVAQSDALSAFESEDEGAGSFVPLTKSFDPASLDGGAVVRVEMSPSALQQFGLSSNRGGLSSAQGNGNVLADMVVASDGTPQAIRLVAK
jgi:hypothetical protein